MLMSTHFIPNRSVTMIYSRADQETRAHACMQFTSYLQDDIMCQNHKYIARSLIISWKRTLDLLSCLLRDPPVGIDISRLK